ncbi:MAG: MATE family efflux transporter [Clostridiaceae bacterium]|nr:MATE family efflux transporter [Clostridiaceae bacterium]
MSNSELGNELRLQDRALIRRYLIPNLIRQASLTILSFFRVAMVSKLSPETASALGSIDFINGIITCIGPALGTGGLLVVAHHYNHRDYEGTGRAAGTAQIIGCVFALLICLPYYFFRRNLIELFYGAATEQVKTYMAEYAAFSSLDCMVFNMISMGFAIQNAVRITRPQSWLSIMQYSLTLLLSYVFINGGAIEIGAISLRIPAMGISGAGLGSLISSLISWLLLQIMLLRERQHFNLSKLSSYRPNRRLMRDILRYGLPPAMENTTFSFSRLLTQSIVVLSGTINTAAITIGNTVSGIYLIPTNAGNTSLTSLGSQAFGRNDFRSVKYYNRFFYLLTTCSQAVMTVLYLLLGSPILGLFTNHPAVLTRAHELLVAYLIVAPLIHHASFGIPCLLRGLGDVRFVMRVSIFTATVVRLFFSWLFAVQLNMQAMGVWLGMFVDWLIRAIIFTIRFYRRKWLPVSAAADTPPAEESN